MAPCLPQIQCWVVLTRAFICIYLHVYTLSFLKDLRNSNFDSNNVFVARIDVNSLFTNASLNETIDIIIKKVFQTVTLAVSLFRKRLCKRVRNCHFFFRNCLYEHVDGAAMGSPLGPLFTNIFIAFHGHSWLANCSSDFKPLFFRRHIDDCSVIFRSRDHVRPFLYYLNSLHPNITFTVELENNTILHFLDVLIDRSNDFSTSVYRKPTFTRFFTNFGSFIPLSLKRSLVYTLPNRYFKICS